MSCVIRRNNSPCLEAELEHARQRNFIRRWRRRRPRPAARAAGRGGRAYSDDQDFSTGTPSCPSSASPPRRCSARRNCWRAANARLFALWPRRLPDGRYRLRLEPEWPGWREAPPAEAAATYMRALEVQVREAPEQYLWVHRRFKTRPPGESSFYA
jgi:KDO2-lipid IV(A) lauroyltransferase